MIEVYPNPYNQSPQFIGYPIRNLDLSNYSYLSSTAFEVGVYDHSTKWGTSHVFYNTYLSATQGYKYSHILFYGGGRLWPSGFDPNVTGVYNNPADPEYDSSSTLQHAIQQAVDQNQPIYLNLNCLVPSFYRAPGVPTGWGAFASASPDPANHEKIASVYSSVVNYFLPSGIVAVTVGCELKGMYSNDISATPGIPTGWDIPRYWNLYEKIYDKIKAIDNSIKVYGPYLQFYDNLPDVPSERINISGVYVRDECVSALNDFIASATAAGNKYDGVGFDAVMPVSAWPTLIQYVREKMAPGKDVIVTECYKDPLDGGDKSDDITTALLQAIEDNLQPNDRAFVWGDPQFFSSAPLILPSITTASSAFVYKCGDPSAWAPFDGPYSVFGAGVTGVAANTFTPWGNKTDVQFNYLNYGTNLQSKIKVGYKKGNITSVDIGPYRKDFNSKWSYLNSSSIEISGIDIYDKLIIHVNNDLSTPLYVFANPIETPPPAQTPGNLANYFYVSAGIWEISAITTSPILGPAYYDGPEYSYRLNVPSNYIVYLAPGAYVDGTFSVRGKHNVTFSGPGVLDPARPYYGNWWATLGFEVTSVTDETKLRRAPIFSFSSFNEPVSYTSPSGIRCIGPTIVNNVTYATTCDMKEVDNTKLISLWPNSDGFHIKDVGTPDPNKYASMVRSFLQTGDDTTYVGGNQGGGDCLLSGCYFFTIAGTTFRTYFGDYNAYDYRNANNYWYSAIDIDCRSYAVPSYHYIQVPLHGSFTNSIFGLSPTEKKRLWYAYYPEYKTIAVTNHLFSGIRVENLIDIPLFDIGARPYPNYDYSPFYGDFSALIFKDITASSHPNSKYNWINENKLFGKERQYRPHDVSFINVVINDKPLTNVNKDEKFVWYNKPIPRDNAQLPSNLVWAGSSVADVYIIIGDSIAAGNDSLYSQRTNTSYSALPSTLTGCYLWVPSSTSFEVIRPGQNVLTDSYYGTGSYPAGVAALESTLAWRARQDSGERDVYIIKYAQGGSMPVSGTSATYDSISPGASPGSDRLDWSVSSSGEMFAGFSSTVFTAIQDLTNNYKFVDLKAVIICLGTNVPIQTAEQLYISFSPTTVTAVNTYKNLSLVSSLIDTEVSSLISGIGGILGTNVLDVDLSYTNYVWVLPLYEDEGFYINHLNNYLKTFNNKVRSFSGIEEFLGLDPQLSSIKVPLKINPYLPPSESYYRPTGDSVHYNFSGIAKITDDIYQLLEQQTSSVTDPSLNPEINYYFSLSNGMKNWVKINGEWKEADTWVKKDGEWKFVTPSVKVSNTWK